MSKMASAGAIKFSQGRRSEAMNIPEKAKLAPLLASHVSVLPVCTLGLTRDTRTIAKR